MLETFFSAPKTLRRLRSGITGPHIDGFADDLERDGYTPSSAVRYIRAAAHLGCFVQRRGCVVADGRSQREARGHRGDCSAKPSQRKVSAAG